MKTSFVPLSLVAAACLTSCMLQAQQTKTLLATPKTVAWGYYWSEAKPVLTINSGDTVTVQTLSTCGPPERLVQRGVAAKDIPGYVGEVCRRPSEGLAATYLQVPSPSRTLNRTFWRCAPGSLGVVSAGPPEFGSCDIFDFLSAEDGAAAILAESVCSGLCRE